MNRVKQTSRRFVQECRPWYEQARLIRAVMRRHGLTEQQARRLIRKGMGR